MNDEDHITSTSPHSKSPLPFAITHNFNRVPEILQHKLLQVEMKYLYLDLLVLPFFHPGTMGHSLKGDRMHLLEEKYNLRGRNVGKMMTNPVHKAKSIAIDAFVGEGINDTLCPSGSEMHVKTDGTVICRMNGTTIAANTKCLPDEEELIYSDGTIMCRVTKEKAATVVVVDNCNPGEEQITQSDGSVACLKMDNTRVVAKKGPRQQEKTVIEDRDCLPGEEKVIKANGKVVCRAAKTTETTVLYYDDDVYYIAERRKQVDSFVLDDDDYVIVKPRVKPAVNPVPVPVPVPVPIVPVPAHIPVPIVPVPAHVPVPIVPVPVPAHVIPAQHGGCDVDGIHPPQAVAGNGNLLYGSDCTTMKSGCMPPMTCQHIGACKWQCKT